MTAPTQLLALVTEAYGAGGGIAQYNRDLFLALSRLSRFEVTVLPRTASATAEPPAGVRQSAPIFARTAYAAGALATALRIKPAVIFCGHLYMVRLAAMIARVLGARLILQLHGIEAWDVPSPAVRRAVEAADLVLCVSRDTRARLLTWSRLAPERALVLANTVGPEFTPGDRAAARRRFGIGDERALLSVSRLDPRERYKGQDRVIECLPRLLEGGPNVRYLIAGEGDDRPRLESLAASAGVSDHVTFLGRVAAEDLPDLYRAADLFALPSTGEGFGIVFLEAMACGVPAVGLDVAGARDALGDGELGDASREAGLCETLRAALDRDASPDLAQRVQARFGAEAFQGRTADMVRRLEELTGAA